MLSTNIVELKTCLNEVYWICITEKFGPLLSLLRLYVCSVIMFAPLLCLLRYYVCSVIMFAPLLYLLRYYVITFSQTVLFMDCFEKREIQKTITFFQFTKVESTKGNCSEMY